jgi:adenine/guanine phosphoribosyltransferase-like PRPP-binding protein
VIRVNVVALDGDTEPLSFDLDTGKSSPVLGTILYVPVPVWVEPREIDRALNRLDGRYLVSADAVVLRVHPSEWAAFAASTAVEDLAARLTASAILTLHWDGDFQLETRSGSAETVLPAAQTLLPLLREAECRALIARTGVELPPDDTYHYEGPNGRHYRSFLRLGTAIQAVDSLDAIAFWLLPALRGADMLVLDTWTILSLGLNAERYWRATAEAVGLPTPAHPLPVECQRRYDEPSSELSQRLRSLRSDAHGEPSVLVINSIVSTGETAGRLREACEQAGFANVDAIQLFSAPESAAEATFCALPQIGQHYAPANCPECDDGSRTVRVLPQTYLLDLAATVHETAIRMPHAQQAIEFFNRYGGVGAVQVHRDQEGEDRHHMVYLDIEALVATPAFRERAAAELQDVLPVGVEVVICPEHRAGRALAGLVCEHLGVPLVAADPERLLELTEDERGLLDGARRVLVADDVVMTGTRLRRYRNMLHRAGFALAQDFELHYLAGVARPDDLSGLRGVVDFVHFPERFHYVELLVLPNWGRDECPWCVEADLLAAHGHLVAGNLTLARRAGVLRDTAAGLSHDLFMHWLRDRGLTTDPFLLGPGSIFSAQDEAELFACLASSLQVLRNNSELNERFTLPVAKVLNRSFTFSGRFYDTAITACLLRATRRHDLRAATTDPDLEAEVRTRLRDAAVSGMQGELLFALQRGHLPGQSLPEVRHVIEDEAAESGLSTVLGAALSVG